MLHFTDDRHTLTLLLQDYINIYARNAILSHLLSPSHHSRSSPLIYPLLQRPLYSNQATQHDIFSLVEIISLTLDKTAAKGP